MQPIGRILNGYREATHVGQARVRSEERRRASCLLDLGNRLGTSLRITATHQDACPCVAEPAGNKAADAVCRSCDENSLSDQLFQLGLPLLTLAPTARLVAPVLTLPHSLLSAEGENGWLTTSGISMRIS